ncbi:MAG: hypothetical protein M3440_15540 [Chloroflexota bacterium]|nr:hypothetical protein [Chloroflexota bacterium]
MSSGTGSERGPGANLPPGFVSAAGGIDGVEAVTGVSRVLVDIESPDGVMLPDMIVQGMDPVGGNAVSRDPGFLAGLGPGTIVAPEYFGEGGYGDGREHGDGVRDWRLAAARSPSGVVRG